MKHVYETKCLYNNFIMKRNMNVIIKQRYYEINVYEHDYETTPPIICKVW